MANSITLINPTSIDEAGQPIPLPLGLASLSAYLIERDVKVNICDMNFKNKIEEETDWYGITSTLKSRITIKEMPEFNGRTVFGGPDPSSDPEYYLEFGDYVIRGEGEKPIYELITGTDPSKTSNLSYKTSTGTQHNPKGPLLDLNKLPIPAYELFDVMKYADTYDETKGLRWLPIVLARGCPHNCYFCAHGCVFGIGWRAPTPKKSVDMIEKLLNLGELDGVHIGDSMFGYNIDWSEAICREIIRRKLKFMWFCYKRVDSISTERLALMKKAGCISISFGLESGSQKTLDAVNKRQTVDAGRTAIALTEANGIIPLANFIVGTPGETEAELEKTEEVWNDLLDKHDVIIVPSIYYPLPGSVFYKRHGEQVSEISRERLEEAMRRVKMRMKEKYGTSGSVL